MSEDETIQSVTQWANETFGPATIQRQTNRAIEEMEELRLAAASGDLAKLVEEAADVVICFYRVIGILDPEAINKKMAVNRARQWKVGGDGCAYHIAEASHD